MKKIIFLVLILNSYLFSYMLYFTNTSGYMSCVQNNLNTADYPNVVKDNGIFQYLGFSSTLNFDLYYPGSSYRVYWACSPVCPAGSSYDKDKLACIPTSCPDGQEIIGNICAVPPTCAVGTLWNPLTDTCEYDPNTADSNSNGIPDKCDPDYVDYLTMDCNNDDEPNGVDDDIDGDGIKNGNDPNPYVNGSASGTPETPCGASSYTFVNGVDEGSCSLSNSAFSAPDFSLNYVSNVYWDSCRQKCGVTLLTCPFGKAIKNGVCTSMEPDEGDCLGTKSCSINSASMDEPGVEPFCSKRCYCLTTQFPIRSPDNLYYEKQVSCSENAGDTTTLDNLRQNSDVNNSLPTDLLRDSNATASLDVSASMKVALDSYAGSKEATQLELLSESKIQSLQLVSANTNLKNIESALENFSAVSTSNDGVINGTLKGIDSGIDTSNALLTEIKDNSEAIKNNLEGKNSDGSLVDISDVSTNIANVDSFLSDIQNSFTNISTAFNDATVNIEQGFNYSVPTGTSVATTVNVFGKSITFDISSVLVHLSPIIYYFAYVSMFLVAIKIIFLGFMVV